MGQIGSAIREFGGGLSDTMTRAASYVRAKQELDRKLKDLASIKTQLKEEVIGRNKITDPKEITRISTIIDGETDRNRLIEMAGQYEAISRWYDANKENASITPGFGWNFKEYVDMNEGIRKSKKEGEKEAREGKIGEAVALTMQGRSPGPWADKFLTEPESGAGDQAQLTMGVAQKVPGVTMTELESDPSFKAAIGTLPSGAPGEAQKIETEKAMWETKLETAKQTLENLRQKGLGDGKVDYGRFDRVMKIVDMKTSRRKAAQVEYDEAVAAANDKAAEKASKEIEKLDNEINQLTETLNIEAKKVQIEMPKEQKKSPVDSYSPPDPVVQEVEKAASLWGGAKPGTPAHAQSLAAAIGEWQKKTYGEAPSKEGRELYRQMILKGKSVATIMATIKKALEIKAKRSTGGQQQSTVPSATMAPRDTTTTTPANSGFVDGQYNDL